MELFAHPFSSYCQKALIALYEHDVPFRFRLVTPMDPATLDEQRAFWPLAKMPVLHDGEHVLVEASIIVEYVDQKYADQKHADHDRGDKKHAGTQPLLPGDPAQALDVRMLDRVFDNYVMSPLQKIVGDRLRKSDAIRDAHGVAEAHALLRTSYHWLDARITGHEWIAGDFSLADCAAAPSLFYADWVEPIPQDCAALRAYRARLLARPSMARCVEEAREFRAYFPGGAPDQD